MTDITLPRDVAEQVLKALESMKTYAETAEPGLAVGVPIIAALRARLSQPERHELQAKGEHPAPCARHCEANAFQIVIKNLQAQLAQPEQEPSGWRLVPVEPTQEMLRATEVGPVNLPLFCWKAMLSAAPNPPQRIWVGLTESELFKLWVSVPAETEDRFAFARVVEAKLKEKNT